MTLTGQEKGPKIATTKSIPILLTNNKPNEQQNNRNKADKHGNQKELKFKDSKNFQPLTC